VFRFTADTDKEELSGSYRDKQQFSWKKSLAKVLVKITESDELVTASDCPRHEVFMEAVDITLKVLPDLPYSLRPLAAGSRCASREHLPNVGGNCG